MKKEVDHTWWFISKNNDYLTHGDIPILVMLEGNNIIKKERMGKWSFVNFDITKKLLKL